MKNLTNSTPFLSSLAKQNARDFYYGSLFSPVKYQPSLIALYAFHAEVSTVRSKIKNALAGEVRLQWWHDALVNKSNDANPILQALIATNLPLQSLADKALAHKRDLYDDEFVDKSEVEGHYGEVYSSLFMLSTMVLNDGKAVECAELAGLAGVAYGVWKHSTKIDLPNYRHQAIPLLKALEPKLKPAFKPFLLTALAPNASDLRKLWKLV